MTAFDDAYAALIDVEKGFQNNTMDAGNWTSGRIGLGSCTGTKYGVSAASYPHLDIVNLTLTQAKAITKKDYWDAFQCDQFDPRIGFQVFDAAFNGGAAAKWLQQAAGCNVDGYIGAQTVAAVRSGDPLKIIMRFDAYRLKYLASLSNPTFSSGWMNRIASNLLKGAA